MTTALNGWGFETNPMAGSSVGGGWFGRGLSSNVFTNEAMKRNTVFLANASPKQTRLPMIIIKHIISLNFVVIYGPHFT